jgi:hypothetical protein
MFKLSAFTAILALCLGTAGLIANNSNPSAKADLQTATDGAYRDGLYIGRLTAQSGRRLSPQVGRWSTERDRAAFLAGYQRGYSQAAGSAQR